MSISRKLKNAASGSSDGGSGGAGGYGDDVFSTYVYTGTGADQTIVNGVDLAGEGGLVWIKNRGDSQNHALFDTERGPNRHLVSNENLSSTFYGNFGVGSFNSNGFDLVGNRAETNSAGDNYASWTFRNAKNFFDVVKYTGDGVAGRKVQHNLGCKPGMVFVKQITLSRDWAVNHRGFNGEAGWLKLNTTDGLLSDGGDVWGEDLKNANDKEFCVGSTPFNNENGYDYVAYVFAHDESDESMIKCGSYTGNNSPSGLTVTLGWEPQWLMIKKATGPSGNWITFDNMRGVSSGEKDPRLNANTTEEEWSYDWLSFTADGFQLTKNEGQVNESADYIYMAIRRPNKPAEEFEPEELFAINTRGADSPGVKPAYVSNFPVDAALRAISDSSIGDNRMSARLTGTGQLATNGTAAETSDTENTWDYMDGWSKPSPVTSTWYSWMWRRAPGFFDVVTYEGDSVVGREIPHNLGVKPEMMWVKCRSEARDWTIYAEPATADRYGNFSTMGFLDGDFWNNTPPTSTHFTVSAASTVNRGSEPMMAYLFASVPGISKVGGYTGNGGNQVIDCGFDAGARFVLVKKLGQGSGSGLIGGSWFLFDSVRGITTSGDPYLQLESTDPQEINPNRDINPHPSGFSLVDDQLNDLGGEFLFYAIA